MELREIPVLIFAPRLWLWRLADKRKDQANIERIRKTLETSNLERTI